MWHSRFTQDKLGCDNLLQKKIQYFTKKKKNYTRIPFQSKIPNRSSAWPSHFIYLEFLRIPSIVKVLLYCSGAHPLITSICRHSFLMHKRSARRKYYLFQNLNTYPTLKRLLSRDYRQA